MPYIKLADRPKFKEAIEQVMLAITQGNETPYIQGEYFGYYVNRITKRFLGVAYDGNSFNSAFFNEGKKKSLSQYADKISAMLNSADPLNSAGDFNYCITAVLWGLMGEAEGVASARYGMRAYLEGILWRIYDSLESPNAGNQRDATMFFRRHLIVCGVLRHVLSETYRRPTSYYEDEKRFENRDIWELGKLVVPTEAS